jgi:hypothetical protein
MKNRTKCVLCSASGEFGFFSFPKNVAKRNLWIKSCNLPPDFIPKPNTRICQSHFKNSDLSFGERKRLSKGKPFKFVCGQQWTRLQKKKNLKCSQIAPLFH